MHSIEFNAEVTGNHEIHLKLPDSVYSQTVKVIVLYEQETLRPGTAGKRQFGQFRDELVIADDFDEPLPESFWTGNEG
jgi:hypothetical protein